MAIFKYELRQLRSYTIWWSVCVAFFVYFMLPLYVEMISSNAVDFSSLGNNSLFEAFDMDINIISTPVGMFGWLTSFFAIAAGINGMFLGLKTFTKETVHKSAEFIYTKPYKRGVVYCAKVSAGLLSAVITGIFYFASSVVSALINLNGGINFQTFSLVALSFMLIEIFFVLFGSLIGTVYSKIRTPFLVPAGIAFMFFVLSAFAAKVQAYGIKYFTPFSYFGVSGIVRTGAYNTGFTAIYFILCIIFFIVGYFTFIKKDVTFIS